MSRMESARGDREEERKLLARRSCSHWASRGCAFRGEAGSVASVAQVTETDFSRYYSVFMPGVVDIFKNAPAEQYVSCLLSRDQCAHAHRPPATRHLPHAHRPTARPPVRQARAAEKEVAVAELRARDAAAVRDEIVRVRVRVRVRVYP